MAASLSKILSGTNFQKLYSAGFTNQIALHNYQIKQDYKTLRKTYSQIASIFLLSEKYRLSYDTIWSAVFRKNKAN